MLNDSTFPKNNSNTNSFKLAQEVIRIRLSQMLINELIKKKEFKIPIHLAFGHEAIAVAISNIMDKDDQLVLSHRNIHYNLARLKLLKPELDEYYLKKSGLAKGILGSMNLANEDKGIIYTSSILGNNLSVAAGLALGKKVKNETGLVTVVTGDGAMEEGSFYETLVFLKSNSLSSFIIVENNDWSLATSINERRSHIDIEKLCESIGVDYERLEGNDVYAYQKKMIELKKYAIENKQPICIEVNLTTLGFWRMKTNEFPLGKFVNYHAGNAPDINLLDSYNFFIIDNSEKDPVYVLKKYFDDNLINETSKRILNELKCELKEEIK
ncbi:hypothetical protein HN385_01235 [archaeon]|jgi:TPP-dependent pyruvate/acetoin dehydrogenase alpha subunit|nr:hypothetical protein [archaeon]MBT3451366.1 hypothetical protein [archaeon]MBT6869318.1 hypothetical protein [archaeon]MBT7192481.1 hypothetical protein [archaeon]MBT7380557.1 hypothetical protein [archaeon]